MMVFTLLAGVAGCCMLMAGYVIESLIDRPAVLGSDRQYGAMSSVFNSSRSLSEAIKTKG
jgi:hypothetical protein